MATKSLPHLRGLLTALQVAAHSSIPQTADGDGKRVLALVRAAHDAAMHADSVEDCRWSLCLLELVEDLFVSTQVQQGATQPDPGKPVYRGISRVQEVFGVPADERAWLFEDEAASAQASCGDELARIGLLCDAAGAACPQQGDYLHRLLAQAAQLARVQAAALKDAGDIPRQAASDVCDIEALAMGAQAMAQKEGATVVLAVVEEVLTRAAECYDRLGR